jgi:hypothetical protein
MEKKDDGQINQAELGRKRKEEKSASKISLDIAATQRLACS